MDATGSTILYGPHTVKAKAASRILAGFVFLAGVAYPRLEATAAAVDLGWASGFAVLAGSAITIATATTITGDIGSYPTPAITGTENLALTGVNHGGDGTTQKAKTDLLAAYGDAVGRSSSATYTDLVGLILAPGVYDGGALALSGTVTLDAGGDPNAVWVFQSGSTLITASGSVVDLFDGAQAQNVFWQVGSSATLGTGTQFAGSILAWTTITMNSGATADGRMLALNGAVNLGGNSIALPVPESSTLHLLAVGMTALLALRRRPASSV